MSVQRRRKYDPEFKKNSVLLTEEPVVLNDGAVSRSGPGNLHKPLSEKPATY